MGENNIPEADDALNAFHRAGETGASVGVGADPPVLYTQMSYEELEECVHNVRDSISEFYLAPQGEIAFVAVHAAINDKIGAAAPDFGKHGVYAPPAYAFHAEAPYGAHYDADPAAGSQYADDPFADDPSADVDSTNYLYPDFPYSNIPPPNAPPGDVPSAGAASADISSAAGYLAQEGPGATPSGRIPDAQAYLAGRLRLPYANAVPIRQIYRESIRKRDKKRRAAVIKFIAACFGGAVFGGLAMLLCVALILPSLGITVPSSGRQSAHEIIHTYEYDRADSQIEAIYSKVSPCVVGIKVTPEYKDFVFERQQISVDGSGIILRSDGYILTSNGIVDSAAGAYSSGSQGGGAGAGPKIEVTLQRDPEKTYQARLIARDVKTDIAILKIDAVNLPAAELGDSDQLRHGEMVIAIGRPAGTDKFCSVTNGIISGFNLGDTSLIQTSAAINQGNSGGALVNSQGQIIGVNVITADSSGYGGLGYAIPINSARLVADNLLDYSYVRGRAKTGIKYSEAFNDNFALYKQQYPEIPQGVYVEYVEPLSGAFKAGVRAGDIITKMKGAEIGDYQQMLALKDTLTPGEIITVELYRDGEYITAEIEVSEETGGD